MQAAVREICVSPGETGISKVSRVEASGFRILLSLYGLESQVGERGRSLYQVEVVQVKLSSEKPQLLAGTTIVGSQDFPDQSWRYTDWGIQHFGDTYLTLYQETYEACDSERRFGRDPAS